MRPKLAHPNNKPSACDRGIKISTAAAHWNSPNEVKLINCQQRTK